MEGEDLLYDEEGSLASVAGECIVGLGKALAHLEGPAERDPILNTLFEAFYTDIVEFGGIGIADAVPDILLEETTPEERAEIIARIQDSMPAVESWSYEAFARLLIEFETEQLEGEAYLVRARELGLTDRLVDRLLELGETDEAVQTAADEPPDDLGTFIPIFERHDQADLIEPLVARRVAENAFGQYTMVRLSLARWLKSRYLARQDFAAALPLSLDDFKSHPNIAGYRELRDLAIQAGDWDALRQDLLAWLAGRAPDLKIQIHLEEGELEEALASVRGLDSRTVASRYVHDVRLDVAEAAAEQRPEAAIDIYLQVADELIGQRGRDNYAAAASLLARARDLLDRLGRYEEWETHIARLRGEHTRLWALREELDRAGL
jgi:uncharacterized Zn finger protein